MDYKELIGKRIRQAREERKWTLAELEQKTGDVLTGKRINAYENGDRMPGPAEALLLSKALGVRAAYLMGLEDIQTSITKDEEIMVRNWRALNERDRMKHFRAIQADALQARDPHPEPNHPAVENPAKSRQGRF